MIPWFLVDLWLWWSRWSLSVTWESSLSSVARLVLASAWWFCWRNWVDRGRCAFMARSLGCNSVDEIENRKVRVADKINYKVGTVWPVSVPTFSGWYYAVRWIESDETVGSTRLVDSLGKLALCVDSCFVCSEGQVEKCGWYGCEALPVVKLTLMPRIWVIFASMSPSGGRTYRRKVVMVGPLLGFDYLKLRSQLRWAYEVMSKLQLKNSNLFVRINFTNF